MLRQAPQAGGWFAVQILNIETIAGLETVAGQVSKISLTGGHWLEEFEPTLCLLSWRFLFCKNFVHNLLVKECKVINSPSFSHRLTNFIPWTRASGFEGSTEGVKDLLWFFIDGNLLRNPLAASDLYGLIIGNAVLVFFKGKYVKVFTEVIGILVAVWVNCIRWSLKPSHKRLPVVHIPRLLLINLIFVESMLVKRVLTTKMDVLQLFLYW